MATLIPVKETITANTEITAANTALSGAYALYVQDDVSAGTLGQTYYMAKWIKLAAAEYTLYLLADDTATISLNGDAKITGSGDRATATPVSSTFSMSAGVYRMDFQYTETGASGTPSWAAYALFSGTELIEVSRAADFVGSTSSIDDSSLGEKPSSSDDERMGYPVFLVKPNWADGVTETLEWYTDVMQSETQVEQRRALRVHPRRSFEASFMRYGPYRTLLDSFLAGVGYGDCLLPLWHDETRVNADQVSGSATVTGDFTLREFQVNTICVIRHTSDPMDYEIGMVTAVSDTAITLLDGLQSAIKSGIATVTPCRAARLQDEVSGTQHTAQVAELQLKFYITENKDVTSGWGTYPVYEYTGLPILNTEPNFGEDVSVAYGRLVYTYDNDSSIPVQIDPGNQSYRTYKYMYHLRGRTQMAAFVAALYAMRGKCNTFHLPNFCDDFELVEPIKASEGAIRVYRCGYNLYDNVSQSTQKYILLKTTNGDYIPAAITASRAVGTEEWLYLVETIGNYEISEIDRIMYMPIARSDVDSFELTRYADGSGSSTCSITFRAFNDVRSVTAVS